MGKTGKYRFPEEKFQHLVGANTYTYGSTGVGKRNSFLFSMSLLLQGSTGQGQERFPLARDLSHGQKRECVSEHLASPALGDAAKVPNFSHTIQSTGS